MEATNLQLLEIIMEIMKKFESNSPPLGVIYQKDKSAYKTHIKKIDNHRFYTFTDGLSESFNEKGEEIGIDG